MPTKIHLVKAMVFSGSHVWMWELEHKESWVPKNWCFWTVVLEKTLESLLLCKGIEPVILKEISPEYSLEGLTLKLKLQYFGHVRGRPDSLEKTLMLEKIEGRKRREDRRGDGWMASLTRWTWVRASSGGWWWAEKPSLLQSMGSERVRHNWATELNWFAFFASLLQSLLNTLQLNCLQYFTEMPFFKVSNNSPISACPKLNSLSSLFQLQQT